MEDINLLEEERRSLAAEDIGRAEEHRSLVVEGIDLGVAHHIPAVEVDIVPVEVHRKAAVEGIGRSLAAEADTVPAVGRRSRLVEGGMDCSALVEADRSPVAVEGMAILEQEGIGMGAGGRMRQAEASL